MEDGREAVVMGKGIGFQKKKGESLEEDKIKKIFTLENKMFSQKLVNLIQEIPEEYFQISERIIRYAEEQLENELNENIYITLTDHIYFAINNYRNGIRMKNSMLWDIKRLYKKEFSISQRALEMICEETGIQLLEDEAASLSLHLVNAQINKDIPEIIGIMNVVQEILNIVKYVLGVDYDENSLNYFRFVTHLKFLAERVFSNTYYQDDNYELLDMVKRKYRKSYECSLKIADFIREKYGNRVSADEIVYLTIHIQRIAMKSD